MVFEGCQYNSSNPPSYQLELVLRKWHTMDRSCKFRCFVCEGRLIGISQRDTNFYDFMNKSQTQNKIVETLQRFWKEKMESKWHGQRDCMYQEGCMVGPLGLDVVVQSTEAASDLTRWG
ncbi:D123-domain-containing protein [Suillus americanus]|nr:D123-domain-containing protein [Suillus americanus]